MATSTCIRCDSTDFELAEWNAVDAEFTLHFIQCAACGGVLGVTDYHNVGGLKHTLISQSGPKA